MKFYDTESSMGVHEVKITFQDQDYKGHVVWRVGGNCKGFSVMDFDNYCWDGDTVINFKENTCSLKFDDDLGCFTMELMNEDGDTCGYELECEELGDYVVAMEILSFEPEIQKHQESEG